MHSRWILAVEICTVQPNWGQCVSHIIIHTTRPRGPETLQLRSPCVRLAAARVCHESASERVVPEPEHVYVPTSSDKQIRVEFVDHFGHECERNVSAARVRPGYAADGETFGGDVRRFVRHGKTVQTVLTGPPSVWRRAPNGDAESTHMCAPGWHNRYCLFAYTEHTAYTGRICIKRFAVRWQSDGYVINICAGKSYFGFFVTGLRAMCAVHISRNHLHRSALNRMRVVHGDLPHV